VGFSIGYAHNNEFNFLGEVTMSTQELTKVWIYRLEFSLAVGSRFFIAYLTEEELLTVHVWRAIW